MGKSKSGGSYPYQLQHFFLVILVPSVYLPILVYVENIILVIKRKQIEVHYIL
jgi:hypothetical protein